MCSRTNVRGPLVVFLVDIAQGIGMGPARQRVNAAPERESRNRLLMCPNHHDAFRNLRFFIRYRPTVGLNPFTFVLLIILMGTRPSSTSLCATIVMA